MPPHHKPRFWRICRLYFRRFRITVWFCLLLVVSAAAYLDLVGLPDFVKRPLLRRLHERGVDVEFSRLRLSWYRGLVAEDVRFERASEPLSPRLTLRQVRVQLNRKALLHFRAQIDSLALRQGRLVWPVAGGDARELSVTNLQAVLRFLPNDEWALDRFQGGIAGAVFQLSGTITNASAIRDWKFLQPGAEATPAGLWQERLRRFADTIQAIHFSATPDLRLDLHGDARDLQSFSLRVSVNAPGADTPWGRFSQGQLTARLFPADTNNLSRVELNLEAAAADTPWASISRFRLFGRLASLPGPTNVVDGALTLNAGLVRTGWADATNTEFTADWVQARTNAVPLSGHGELRADEASTPWGASKGFELLGDFALVPAAQSLAPPDAALAWWTNLEPYVVSWQARLADFQSSNLFARAVACVGSWRAPALTVTNLHANLYRGQVEAQAALDVSNRVLKVSLVSSFDPHYLAPLLDEREQAILDGVTWGIPPQFRAETSLVLPPWTARDLDWGKELLPSLRAEGELRFDDGVAYKGLGLNTLRTHFAFSNEVWRLPDLRITWPNGHLEAAHEANRVTRDYYFRVSTVFDPALIRPLLGTNALEVLDLLKVTELPVVQAELWGRFDDPDRLGFAGRFAATNFAFRGQEASGLQTGVQYTNGVLSFIQPRVHRGQQVMSADGLSADFNGQLIYLTNGFSTADPMFIARVIGPQIVRDITPFRFLEPPTGHVHGAIPMHGEDGADLHFDLDGGPFNWARFNLPHLSGHIHWLGEELTLTNVAATFYGGQAAGDAHFAFQPDGSANYSFHLNTRDTQLQWLLADVAGSTNKIEGWLTGNLFVTRANTDDPAHVNGHGNASLRDGLIWNIPIFGFVSPVLNGIYPGLGNNRANAASCTFTITNSVIRTRDLKINAQLVNLRYDGTVDLNYRVNATVEAYLLPKVPLVEMVLTPVTKLFAFDVTGTLEEPKTRPKFIISNLVLRTLELPFHPIRTLKGLLPEEKKPAESNPALPPPK